MIQTKKSPTRRDRGRTRRAGTLMGAGVIRVAGPGGVGIATGPGHRELETYLWVALPAALATTLVTGLGRAFVA